MPVVREVGRPRSFEDDAIFAATARVIARVGHDGLTLAAIAEEVGCSAPALVQRFGSKRALVRAYIEWSIDNIQQRWDKVSAPELSPVEAIKARFQMPRDERPDEATAPEGFPSTVYFHLVAWEDEALRPLVNERRQNAENQLCRMLELATQAGEISGCDEAQLASTMFTVFQGAALQSLVMPGAHIEERLGELVEALIAPYRTDRARA
jgi:AcrR family transcriptional regulator